MHLGTGELLLLAFILVVVFSASRMGQLGNALGKFVYSFKKASKGDDFVEVKGERLSGGKSDKVVDAEIVDEKKK
ncbi:MAG: twin-arginine translocase TatA/TatE family subunit [Myxococcaceae bacterium]